MEARGVGRAPKGGQAKGGRPNNEGTNGESEGPPSVWYGRPSIATSETYQDRVGIEVPGSAPKLLIYHSCFYSGSGWSAPGSLSRYPDPESRYPTSAPQSLGVSDASRLGSSVLSC